MSKLMEEDKSLTDEMALIWATHGYNAAEMRTGFSPHHMMFGVSSNMAFGPDSSITETDRLDLEYEFLSDLKARREAIINHQMINNAHKMRQLLLRKS